MKMRMAFLSLLLIFVISGCRACSCKRASQTKTEPKTQEKAPWEKPGVYLKWVLKLLGDQITTVSLSRVESRIELGPYAEGDYVAVASSKEKKLAAFPFRFPSEWQMEGMDEQGNRVTIKQEISEDKIATVWIHLEQTIDRLSVNNPQGNVVLQEDHLSSGEPLSALKPLEKVPEGKAAPPPPSKKQGGCQLIENQEPGFSHIQFLGPEDVQFIPRALRDTSQAVLVPWDDWRDLVRQALSSAAPATLAGVTHIGFVRVAAGGPVTMLAGTIGSVIVFNAGGIRNRSEFMGTVIHEVAHTYDNLLSRARMSAVDPTLTEVQRQINVPGQPGYWDEETRTLAIQTARRFGANAYWNFSDLWEVVHHEAKRYNLTFAYVGDAWLSVDQHRASANGFAYNYGTSNAYEDVATYVEKVQGSTFVGEPAFCNELRGATDQFNMRLAMPYIKLMMLKNAGFITPEKAQACHGDVVIRGERGIHFLNNEMRPVISFTSKVKAGHSTEQGVHYFNILGDGPHTYQVLIQFVSQDDAGQRKIPLGLHRLDNIGPLSINLRGNNGVYMAHSNNFKAKTSATGLVLISDYSLDPVRLEGAVFFLTLRGAGGPPIPIHPLMALTMLDQPIITDTFPLVTFLYEP